ncbi:hypothetical protein STENM327S_00035 [Streptomyces tendae]
MRIFGKARHRPSASWRQATDRAFTLIGDGRYKDAGALLTRAADLEPWLSESWFNLALLHKFRHDWEQARAAGLRAVALLDRDTGAPDWWNVGIAATALQDWPLARRAWQAYGLRTPGRPPTPVSRSAWTSAALPYGCRRRARPRWCGGGGLDPARVEVLSIPLPSSGRRWGEVVLHDGVPHGERTTSAGHSYPVFDEIELWAPSPVPTWVVLLEAATESDRDALEQLAADAGFNRRGLVVLRAAAVPDVLRVPDAVRRGRGRAPRPARPQRTRTARAAGAPHRRAAVGAGAGVRGGRAGRAGEGVAGRVGGREAGLT